MILGLLLLQAQTVTFEHPCAQSSVVLEALGNEVHMDLRPSGSVNDDYIVARFAGVPLQEALEKLAKTLNATWTKEGGITYLGRTRPQEVADFNAEYAEKAKLVKEALKAAPGGGFDVKAAEALALKVRDFGAIKNNDDWARFQPLAAQTPGHRAMLALISLLDIDDIVRTTATPITYGNEGQARPLPTGTEKILEQLSREWADYSAATARAGLPSTDVYQKLSGGIADLRAHLQFEVHMSDTNVLFMLSVLADNAWQNIGYLSIGYDSGGEVPTWAVGLTGKLELDAPSLQSVQASQITEGHAELLGALLGGGGADTALSAPGAALLQAAKARGASMVASVPDACYLALASSKFGPGTTVSQALSPLFASRLLKAEEADGWITVRPTNPYRERWKRMDREAFRRMCQYAALQKGLPLDRFADFVATTKDDDAVKVANSLFGRAFALSLPVPSFSVGNIRIYGLLPSSERLRSRKESVELTGRPDVAKYAIALWMLASKYYEFDEAAPTAHRQPFREQQDALDSLPRNTSWSVRVVPETFVQPRSMDQGAGEWGIVWDVQSYAMNTVLAERRPANYSAYDFSSVAAIAGYSVTIEHASTGGRVSGGSSFSHYADPMTALKYGSINDLPEELLAAIAKKQDEYRKQRGGG